MPAPLIGLTASLYESLHTIPVQGVAAAYIDAVIAAGGIPVLIPAGLDENRLAELSSLLHGLIFTGGGDIDPARFGGQPHPRVGGVDPARDHLELNLAQQAAQGQIPFLGICRGFQVVNVALGGTLYTDIGDQHPGALRHDWYPNIPRDTLAHPVRVEPGTRLAEIFEQTEAQVNSLHHQGALQVAPGLRVSAVAPDGLVEGLEIPGHPFGVAVQWHPEWLQNQAPMRALFRALVTAAQSEAAR